MELGGEGTAGVNANARSDFQSESATRKYGHLHVKFLRKATGYVKEILN